MKKRIRALTLGLLILVMILSLSSCIEIDENGIEYQLLDDGTYEVYNGKDCTDTDIQIPSTFKGKTVTSINFSAFEGCSSLKSIKIPDSVTLIGVSAFKGCTSLASINIPDSVTEIGSSTFEGCSSLESIELPDGLTHIGDYSFWHCTNLTRITIPNSVTSIGDSPFSGCDNLTDIHYEGTMEEWNDIYGCYNLNQGSIVHCTDGVVTITG